MEGHEVTQDARVVFVNHSIQQGYRHVKLESVNKFLQEQKTKDTVIEYLNSSELRLLLINEIQGSFSIHAYPKISKLAMKSAYAICNSKRFYFAKLNKAPISMGQFTSEMITGDFTTSANFLQHLQRTLQKVFLPLLRNPSNQEKWPDMVHKDVTNNLQTFLANVQIIAGQSKGQTCLPLPSQFEPESSAVTDRVHVLEGCLITWTKQIKNLLRQDSESLMKQFGAPNSATKAAGTMSIISTGMLSAQYSGNSSIELCLMHPGPLIEIAFWKYKKQNLNLIFEQLQSDRIRNVLHILDQSQSTYNIPFAKLCKEVFQARDEANDNARFLLPLTPWFERLQDPKSETFAKITELFPPILHCLLLIWKSSSFYNTSTQLVVIIQMICNAIIRRGYQYLNGQNIFQLIQDNDTFQAVEMLQVILKVSAKFKRCYFTYKAKVNIECPKNTWRIQNNALFVRLETFLERCHDVLELTQTIVQFSKLSKIEIGGTKGKTLTTSALQIYADFNESILVIQNVHYDIMDIEARMFEDDFYAFRLKIKELERRLASVLKQSFDDSHSILGQFQLYEALGDELLERPIIKAEVEKQMSSLILMYHKDLQWTKQLFHQSSQIPPIAHNLPPFAGALSWCRGLLDRIEQPMMKFQRFIKINPLLFEREDAKETIKLFTNLVMILKDYQQEKIDMWAKSIEASTQTKLKLPLLRRNDVTKLLIVNFDPVLIKLLREVKYFLGLGLEVPETATAIYCKAETFRRQTGNLDLIVNMYNNVQTRLLAVERPLVKTYLDRMDEILAKGLRQLNWKSHGIDLFLKESMSDVSETNQLLEMMKSNLVQIEQMLSQWAHQPVFDRKGKPLSVEEFEESQKILREEKYNAIQTDGKKIHQLLKDIVKRLKVSQGSPHWRSYLEYINTLVSEGLFHTIQVSLTHLARQLELKRIEADDIPPILEIDLDLYDKEVIFSPSLEPQIRKRLQFEIDLEALNDNDVKKDDQEDRQRSIGGLKYIVQGWIEAIFRVSSIFPRLDSSKGTYLKEMREHPELRQVIDQIYQYVEHNEQMSMTYRSSFLKYEYLWKTDLAAMFQAFVQHARHQDPSLTSTASGGTEEDITEDVSRIDDKKSTTMDLSTIFTSIDLAQFEAKILHYLGLQNEISDSKHNIDLAFIRVNSQPIKQALSTWVTKWIYMFTQYLHDIVMKYLFELHQFMDTVSAGLHIESDDLNLSQEKLMLIMGHIRDVRFRMVKVGQVFPHLRDVVQLLKAHGIQMENAYIGQENVIDFLEQAPVRWEGTVNQTFKTKEAIQSLQNQTIEQIGRNNTQFVQSLEQFYANFRNKAPFTYTKDSNLNQVYTTIDQYHVLVLDLEEKEAEFHNLEELFELGETQYDLLVQARKELKYLKTGWDMVCYVENTFTTWESILWIELSTDDLLQQVSLIQSQMKKLPREMKSWQLIQTLTDKIINMATILPLIEALQSSAMRERHWKQIFQVTMSSNFEKTTTFCFQDVIELELYAHVDKINGIVELATKEERIEHRLQNIEQTWKSCQFQFCTYQKRKQSKEEEVINAKKGGKKSSKSTSPNYSVTTMHILESSDDIIEILEEQQLQLQAISKMGTFVEYFRERVTHWQQALGNVDIVLKLWTLLQKQWCSVEPIFSCSEDIRTQLPKESKSFEKIDNEMQTLCQQVYQHQNVLQSCTQNGRESHLREMMKELEVCQKALNEYLDLKKNIFPRFYFVSNMGLLDILSNGTNPPRIVPHLNDCFEGIHKVEFRPSSSGEEKGIESIPTVALAIFAKDGERIEFTDPFHMEGAVELWLKNLVKCMQKTLQDILEVAMESAALWEVEKPRDLWIFDYPAQLALLASQMLWTEETELALEELENGQGDAVKKYSGVCADRLNALIKLAQTPLSGNDRVKVITLITIDVHSRDIIESLIEKNAENNMDFCWQSQLRYYWDNGPTRVSEEGQEENHVEDELDAGPKTKRQTEIRICDFRSLYSYEYIGNCGRLVVTPLTDRCYVTLTTALRLNLGGAPAGPAGTGKTETTKDLARGLGLQCFVFNCSDQMNYQTMADIFKGLAQTGAWGCFDEFNRIPIEVLSVVATQVKSVLDAISYFAQPSNRKEEYQHLPAGTPPCQIGEFSFSNEMIALVPTCGFFITMNPGYAGRTELPENLKVLFRSCAMIRPDLEPICENMLMAEGFIKARALSIKFVMMYELCDELLSKQVHYDWGLRAVKSVLCVAGSLKRAEPEVDEEAILMRALRDFNAPKIPKEDTAIFQQLISDLFPALDLPTKIDEKLKETCIQVCAKRGIQAEETFIQKVTQYQELLNVRHSVMILGPAGCGKTTIWQTLADCHNHNDTAASDQDNSAGRTNNNKPRTVYETVNPKAVTSDELYGFMTLSKDWKDGVLSIIMRAMSKEWAPYSSYQTGKWVVLDGDIDSVWIESMNTVMDDNKVLTLVSNERIPLQSSMRMIFEINSLKNATPATVSRAGILYINESDIGWPPYVQSWINRRSNGSEALILNKLFDRYIEKIFDWFRKYKELKTIISIPKISHISVLCTLLSESLSHLVESQKTFEVIENIFIYLTIWAFGGALSNEKSNDCRQQFSSLWTSTFFSREAGSNVTSSTSKWNSMSENASIFDYFYKLETNELIPWTELIPAYHHVGELQVGSIVIPITETVRNLWFLDQLATKARAPVLLVGAAGTGKTALIKEYLHNMDESKISATINMNYFTDSKTLQNQLELYVEKRSGRIYGPLQSKEMVYFLDDLNMPFVEEFGTQAPLALLRQYMDYHSWYDRYELGSKKIIQDVQFLAAMNHTSGSFVITPRLQRHFATFACMIPSEADLNVIYQTILNTHLGLFSEEIRTMSSSLVQATLKLYSHVCQGFLPSAVKFHYTFNMRDLANIFQGLVMSKPEYYVSSFKFLRLWLHECERVFSDRLVSLNESGRFQSLLVEISKKHFEEDPEVLHARPLIFTNFMTFTVEEEAVYYPVMDKAVLKHTLEQKLAEYNDQFPIMNLVLFDQAMEHVTRITRILSSPRGGHALLIGVGGSGKQSLSKLAAFICGYPLSQLAIRTDYGLGDFRDHLRDLVRKSGIKPATPLVLLLRDTDLVHDTMLVYINDLLSSGYIPDLFTSEELDAMLLGLRTEAKVLGIPDTRESLMEFYVERVKQNLHLVLAFSPIGSDFRTQSRRFPSLVNCTAIDWFHPWPKEALVNVAQNFLADVVFDTPMIQENVSYHMAEVHLSVQRASERYREVAGRSNYVTPTSFLELIHFYTRLLKDRRATAQMNVDRLTTGLKTLHQTAHDVKALKEDLKSRLSQVEEKKRDMDALLEQMGHQRREAEEKQALADTERTKAETAAAFAGQIELEAQVELEIAKPAMDKAKEAVDCLSKASLTELKSMTKPPAGVDRVTAAVLMLVKNESRNLSWENAKKMMAKVDAFKSILETFEAETIPADVISRVDPILLDPNFTFEKMKSKSHAAANLCTWVINIVTYHKIYNKVKPLMDGLAAAKVAKVKAESDLAQVLATVATVVAQLSALQTNFREATNEKAQVEAEALSCQERLNLAERLVSGLSSENERWAREVDELEEQHVTLVGDVLLAAAFVSYVGAFDAGFREHLWKHVWLQDLVYREIPTREALDPLDILVSDSKIATWMNQGLPADRISIENGCIVSSCDRWPLCIDPQLQGLKWIREKVQDEFRQEAADGHPHKQLVMVQTTQPHWIQKLTQAIVEGEAVVIEHLGEELDTTLNPLLARAVTKKGRNLFLNFGGQELSYDPTFQLFLQTKLANPHYRPEIAAQCTLINFTVTESGLEDQLLAKVVHQEQSELELEKRALQLKFNQYKIELLELENQLLERLSNAPVDILSDVPLIEGLETTKETANEINYAVLRGKETEVVINEAREVYRPVASEGAMQYFMIAKLCSMNHMYQYSLEMFEKSFFKALKKTEGIETSTDARARVEALRESLRFTMFTMIRRGLYEQHKLTFLTHLTFNLIQRQVIGEGSGYAPEHHAFLLSGTVGGGEDNADPSPIAWLNDRQWQALQALVTLEGFETFISDLEESEGRFEEWYNSEHPEHEKLPLEWRELEKKPFLKLCVLRCLRPDRMIVAISAFIRETLPLGSRYIHCDADLNSFQLLQQTFEDMTPTIPIYFVLCPGTDVVSDVDKLAMELGKVKGVDYHNIALGQGQDVVAMAKLRTGTAEGHWVILNNVHLMARWLVTLESTLDALQEGECHDDFRLFISSDACVSIPIGLLDRSLKLTHEPPSGLKANLRRAFCQFGKLGIEDLETRTRGIVFGMCYFHAIMVERKKFGPQGFNLNYPFAMNDLTSSCLVLQNYMSTAPARVPWRDLRYLFGEIMYGGHIVNDFDRLLTNTYLEYYLRDALLEEMDLYPYKHDDRLGSTNLTPNPNNVGCFRAPNPTFGYDKILDHIELEMTGDTPVAFGFHPNAELAFRTETSLMLFQTLGHLSSQSSTLSSSSHHDDDDAHSRPMTEQHAENQDSSSHRNLHHLHSTAQLVAEEVLQDTLENFKDTRLSVENLENLSSEERGPFQNVLWQEVLRMNVLLEEITKSLVELDAGFRGDLTMTEDMDELMTCLYAQRVPRRWQTLAYASLRPLSSWLVDLDQRVHQLVEWTSAPVDVPKVIWISGLFNPRAFLTATCQKASQELKIELNALELVTEVSKKHPSVESIDVPSRDGQYVFGLSLVGARWDRVTHVIAPSVPRELFSPMPVFNCRASVKEQSTSRTTMDGQATKHIFRCPVYKTQERGPTYVFSAQLKTKSPAAKWILAGVALVMDITTI